MFVDFCHYKILSMHDLPLEVKRVFSAERNNKQFNKCNNHTRSNCISNKLRHWWSLDLSGYRNTKHPIDNILFYVP